MEYRRRRGKLLKLRDETFAFLESSEQRAAAANWNDDEVEAPQAKKIPVPLQWYLDCQQYQCLLVNGGLLDQPVWYWTLMQEAGYAYRQHLQDQQAIAEALNRGE